MADSSLPKVSLSDLRLDDRDRSDAGGGGFKRTFIAILVLALLAVVGFYTWRRMSTPVVRVAAVHEAAAGTTSAAVLNASGYVTARRQATVSSKVTGKVIEVLVEEGMKVGEGQVLARLDDALLRRALELEEARAKAAKSALAELEVRLAEAELNLKRKRELVEARVTAQSELDAAQANVDSLAAQIARTRDDATVAERSVALTREQLGDTVIRAPFAGVAISKDAQPGEMISPVSAGGGFTRTGICTIVDMSSLEIEVDVGEVYIHRVLEGQKVEAVLDAYADWRIPAHVITTIPTADRQKATVKVRIAFDALDPRILPDMGVKVAFLEDATALREAPKRRFLVPQSAVRAEGEQGIVFVLLGDTVERRAVTVGAADGADIEIKSGVASGEEVVLEPSPGLTDGARVRRN